MKLPRELSSEEEEGASFEAYPIAKFIAYSPAQLSVRSELLKFFLLVSISSLIGWACAYPLAGYAVGASVYLLSQLRHLYALRLWLEAPKRIELPEAGGIWGEVFDELLELQKSNRKRKKKLAAIVAEFRASTAALPDGAVVLGARGEIAWFNAAAQAMLGLHGKVDVGVRLPNLIRHPAFTEYVSEREYRGEVEVPSPVNPNVRISLRIIPYGKGQRLMIVRDVSEFRRLETARRDFVANASHELRTPLTVLRGYLDMIEPESKGEGPLSAWSGPLQEMRVQAKRMESLIKDMLKLASLESEIETQQAAVDVAECIRRAVQEAKTLAHDTHEFEMEIDAELFLFGREIEAQSIFSNLILNAVRYSPEGGKIRILWRKGEEGGVFAVSDSGIGISEEDLPRVTERFYRVDIGRSRASGGTGLGLSIVKHALQRHEGRLEIASELGRGSTFSCYFPSFRMQTKQQDP